MDIRVGSPPPVGGPGDKTPARPAVVEARVLALRGVRRRPGRDSPEGRDRRRGKGPMDPVNGKVLVLLIPDGGQLPPGLDKGGYRVFLRFARR